MSRVRTAVLVLAFLVGTTLGSGERTLALLGDAADVDAGAFSTGALSAPGAPTVGGPFFRREYRWSPAVLDAGGSQPPPITYRVLFYDGPDDLTPTQLCSTTGTTCQGGLLGQVGGGQVLVVAEWETWSARSPRTRF